MSRFRYPALVILVLLLAAGLAACGGGGGNSEDPAQVINETFASGKDYSSGVVDVELAAQGQGSRTPAFDVSAKGPFENAPGGFPKFDLTASIKSSVPFSGGLISTGNSVFIKVGGTNYQVDQNAFNTYKQYYLALQSVTGKASGAGVQPAAFFTGLKNDGSTDVNGTKAIHVSGNLDIDKLIAAAKLASKGQQSSQRLDQARSQIQSIGVQLFSDESSKRLVKLQIDALTKATATSPAGDVKFTLGFSNLGQPQTISAPANPQPLGNLAQLLQGLGSSGASGSSSGGGSGTSSGAAGTPTVPSASQTQTYEACLAKAKGTAALQACNSAFGH